MENQRGSAIFIILIAVALFGALAYAFTQNPQGNTGIIMSEAAKAHATGAADYSNAVNLAAKRLKLRGCADAQISYETPSGNNPNPAAPEDGHCHVFSLAGGSVKYTGDDTIVAPGCTMIGDVCSDGAIYIGDIGSDKLYIRPADSSTNANFADNFGDTPGTNTTDGVSNTDIMMTSPSGLTYAAAQACRAHGPAWYLPAKDELGLLWQNRAQYNLVSLGINTASKYYWTSTQFNTDASRGWAVRFNDGNVTFYAKTTNTNVRCFRREI